MPKLGSREVAAHFPHKAANATSECDGADNRRSGLMGTSGKFEGVGSGESADGVDAEPKRARGGRSELAKYSMRSL